MWKSTINFTGEASLAIKAGRHEDGINKEVSDESIEEQTAPWPQARPKGVEAAGTQLPWPQVWSLYANQNYLELAGIKEPDPLIALSKNTKDQWSSWGQRDNVEGENAMAWVCQTEIPIMKIGQGGVGGRDYRWLYRGETNFAWRSENWEESSTS